MVTSSFPTLIPTANHPPPAHGQLMQAHCVGAPQRSPNLPNTIDNIPISPFDLYMSGHLHVYTSIFQIYTIYANKFGCPFLGCWSSAHASKKTWEGLVLCARNWREKSGQLENVGVKVNSMNAAINFSRFAYRSAKPRLTLYERHDKENLPAAASRRSPTPNNATPIPSTRSARDTPRGGNERRLPTVVPETPDEESVSSCGRGRRRMRPAAERDRRRKRQRLSSSSSSSGGETETESRDAGRGSGARDGRRTGGLFGSLQVSKRQKRSVELSVFEYQPNSDKKSPPKNDRKEAAGGESSELTDSPPPVSKLKCCGRRNLESDSSESESEECCEVSQRNRGSATTTLVTLPPAQCEDGWLTCRRKPLHSLTTTTSSNGTGRRRRRGGVKAGEMKDGRPGERWERELVGQNKEDSTLREGRPGEAKELDSLRQLFPQYSEMFLRDRLRESAAMDEAVASILASDGKFTLNIYSLVLPTCTFPVNNASSVYVAASWHLIASSFTDLYCMYLHSCNTSISCKYIM